MLNKLYGRQLRKIAYFGQIVHCNSTQFCMIGGDLDGKGACSFIIGINIFLISFLNYLVNFYYSWDQATYENLRLKIVSILFAMQSGLGGLQLHYRDWKNP